jgi:hypothetical protein
MAYRNGTYVAFHAEGTNRPGESDMDYYNLMKAWSAKTDDDFTMINSHDKASAVRDSSKKSTLRASLLERLRNSRNMVLIIGQTTRFDTDWVPFEIEQAVDTYKIPIIATYPNQGVVLPVAQIQKLWPNSQAIKLSDLWPEALADRINNQTAKVIHIPFKKAPLLDAIIQFDHDNLPSTSETCYGADAYQSWGLLT